MIHWDINDDTFMYTNALMKIINIYIWLIYVHMTIYINTDTNLIKKQYLNAWAAVQASARCQFCCYCWCCGSCSCFCGFCAMLQQDLEAAVAAGLTARIEPMQRGRAPLAGIFAWIFAKYPAARDIPYVIMRFERFSPRISSIANQMSLA